MFSFLVRKSSFRKVAVASVTAAAMVSSAFAADENVFFGGKGEKFKGAGDKQPPGCEVVAPRTADDEFFLRWNCVDQFDNTPQDKIRTAIWIKRAGDTRYFKIDDFLGFPASLKVDRSLLRLAPDGDFRDGLPVTFRVEAMDTAGITTITDPFTVQPGRTLVETCTLKLVTSPTESTGDSVGTPSSEVLLDSVPIRLDQVTSSVLQFSSRDPQKAVPCEISEVCSNDDKVSFSANLQRTSTEVSGQLSILPGDLSVSMTGSATLSNDVIASVDLSGMASVDGVATDVTLTCATSGAGSSTTASETTSDSETATEEPVE